MGNDPIGFTGKVDTFNRYSYVANNPYRYTDPKGMAKCGSNLKGQKCEEALNAADRASADAKNVSGGIKSITAKMAAGEKLSAKDNATVSALGEKFGKNFTSEKGLNKLAKGLDKAADKIGERGQGATLKQGNNWGSNTSAYVLPIFSNSIYINDHYFKFGADVQARTMLHEGAHLAGKFGDDYIRRDENGVLNNERYGTEGAFSNADTYACSVYPTTCGL